MCQQTKAAPVPQDGREAHIVHAPSLSFGASLERFDGSEVCILNAKSSQAGKGGYLPLVDTVGRVIREGNRIMT